MIVKNKKNTDYSKKCSLLKKQRYNYKIAKKQKYDHKNNALFKKLKSETPNFFNRGSYCYQSSVINFILEIKDNYENTIIGHWLNILKNTCLKKFV